MKMLSIKLLALSLMLSGAFGCVEAGNEYEYTDNPESSTGRPQVGVLDESAKIVWNFTDKEGWVTSNQGQDPVIQDEIIDWADLKNTDGRVLRIWTEPGTYDRKKVKTVKQYGSGRYKWHTKITDLLERQRVSIGSWLWHDDTHELDFEVGSGKEAERRNLQLDDDHVIAYITSQANPELSEMVGITKNDWHIFEIDLKLVNEKYLATWIIDGVSVAQKQLNYGEEYPFYIFCSVENLHFVGDFESSQQTNGYFDYVSFTPYTYSIEPVVPDEDTDPINPPPPVKPGETVSWEFDEDDIPEGWSRWTNVGTDAPGMLTVSDGYLRAKVVKDYPPLNGLMNLRYDTPTTMGTYKWKVKIEPIDPNANFFTGGQVFPIEGTPEGRSISIDVMWGSDAARLSQNAQPDELLVRASGEKWDAVGYRKVKPGEEHEFQIVLGTDDEGMYTVTWLLDGAIMATRTADFGPDETQYNMICVTQNNWKWYNDYFNGVNITRDYYGLFDYAEYTTPGEPEEE